MVDKFSKIVCLLLTILPVCKSNNNNSQLANYNKYLLPNNVLPLKYYIKLTPHLHNDVYMGYIKIQINVTKNTNNITMHQNGLVIQPEKVYLMRISSLDDNRTIINHDGISKSVEEDFYIIQFNQTLLPGIYELVIPQYFGVYRTNSMTGLYSVTYHEHHNITQKLVLSYFEPTYARYAFPCFDEPELKARFKIFIIRPWNYQSGSNGILIKSTYLHNSLVEDEFEETNLLPTYTIAFFVSNLAISKKVKGSIHQILARPKLIKEDQVKSFLELAKRASDNIATFVKKQLPLKKIYHIAIPENKMLYPAMENSGIITYWESNLFRPNDSTIGRIEAITNVIVHELVHEWFGNLVTLKWWNFFWLNEGMAVYLAYKITDNLYPEWSKMQDLQIAVLNIMKTDSENDSTSLNHYCNSPEDIYLYKFTPLILNKGAAMIRMMESILSTEIFRKGLQYYVNDREFKSATPDDLYKNLDKAVRDSNIKLLSSVSHIMETWDSQRGFPIVEVKRNYGFDSFNVQLTQKWCILYNFFKSKPIWFIPINYATKSNPNFYNQQASDWLTKEKHNIKIKDLRKNDWLILNTKGTYYYRVNYDLRNWDLISKALMYNHKEIDLHNRAQIIDDAFSLAKLGVIPYRIPLKVSEYFFKEMDYAPLKVMKEVFDDLKVKLMGTSAEQNFITYFTKGVVSVYDQLENRDQTMENHIHQKAVLLIFSWLCELQHKKCFARVDSMFKDYRSGKTLPVDLEEQVLCTSMERGQEPHWFYLFETIQFKKEREYNRYLTLACSTNSMLLQRFLVYSATLLQKTELVKAFQAVIQQGRIGFKVSLRFIMKRFKALMDRLETNDMKIILTSLSSKITTAEDLEVLEKLSNTHKKTFRDLFEPGILKAHENIEWNNKYQNEINTYLGNFDRSGTASYFNTLGIKNFNIMMFYVGVGILY